MRPYDTTRVWRKDLRAALKGIPRGRRTTHRVKTQQPERESYVERARRRRAGLPLWPLDYAGGA